MSHSRHYARPFNWQTGAGDPRGVVGASASGRTAFRYRTSFAQWGSGASPDDPVRYDGRGYITDVSCVNGSGIPNGFTVVIVDGFGNVNTYEFRSSGSVTPGNILVSFAALDSATQIRDSWYSATAAQTCHLQASQQSTNILRFAQSSSHLGGRTGFPYTDNHQGGVMRSQSAIQFTVNEVQSGYDPVNVLPAWVGPCPRLISVNSHPIFLVT